MSVATFVSDRAAIDRLRATIADEMSLYEVRDDDWAPADVGVPFDWTATRPLVSPKRFLFPPREAVLQWDATGVMAEVPVAAAGFALFGLRACDATAIAVQDRFFAADPRYRARRAGARLIAIDCDAACAGGFCRDVAAGPFAGAGCDLALTPLPDDVVLVTVATAAGVALLERAGIDRGADGAPQRRIAQQIAEGTFPHRPFVAATIARLSGRATPVAVDEWHALAPSCLACTGCTSLCPTCTCSATADESDGDGGGTRSKLWDSCLLGGFQREAGSHPAAAPADRVRRFWEHKLSEAFVPAVGRLGCVGCGRCDVTCAGSIGALHVTGVVGA